MCLSVQGSFAVAGLLACVGAASIWNAKSKPYLLFSLIPFIFAMQMVAEGLLWININQDLGFIFSKLSKLFFLSIVLIIWPIWVPISLYVLEKENGLRELTLKLMILCGILFAICAILILYTYSAEYYVYRGNIVFDFGGGLDMPSSLLLTFYCIPTIFPFFFSQHKSMCVLGITLIFALAVSIYVKYELFFSVWCYLSILISILVFATIKWENKKLMNGMDVQT